MFYDDQQHERQENSGNNQSLTEVKFGTTMPGAPYRLIVTGSLKSEKKILKKRIYMWVGISSEAMFLRKYAQMSSTPKKNIFKK